MTTAPPRLPPIVLCRSRDEIVRALTDARLRRGIPQQALDDKAGWTDGYTSKLEQPSTNEWKNGQRSALHPSFDLWIGALGVAVVIIPDLANPAWRDALADECVQSLSTILGELSRKKRQPARTVPNNVKPSAPPRAT